MNKKLKLGIEVETERLQMILDAIAKHVDSLKKELRQIDSIWICDCGSKEYADEVINNELVIDTTLRTCLDCKGQYVVK